jgi:hypothetical protein
MHAVAVRPEQVEIQALIQKALRAAATAPTIFDALDVAGAALHAIQELSRKTASVAPPISL